MLNENVFFFPLNFIVGPVVIVNQKDFLEKSVQHVNFLFHFHENELHKD